MEKESEEVQKRIRRQGIATLGISKHGFDDHERRDFHGRWSKTGGALQSLEQNMNHTTTGAVSSRRAGGAPVASHGSKIKGTFDHAKKSIGASFKIKPPQKGSKHQLDVDGIPINKTGKTYTPEEAYYLRNNGKTGISSARLKAIYEDRSKVTPQEHDLIMAAKGDSQFDGLNDIKFHAVRLGGTTRSMERYKMFKELRTQLAADFSKDKNLGSVGAGGQRRFNSGAKADAQNAKDSAKRIDNGRNKYESLAKRKELLHDFGDGETADCIFCGDATSIEDVSPERIKPGLIGGKYERGNVAPSHVKCNVKAGTYAQHKPEEYYDVQLKRFLEQYSGWIGQGYLGFVFAKHRGKLAGKRKVNS